ncbi:MAG: type II secretion system secretin GspD [Bdellovibrionales bacterium]|nr:type II secretion system secretin GspD [Bdellovibrionales bacterium]
MRYTVKRLFLVFLLSGYVLGHTQDTESTTAPEIGSPESLETETSNTQPSEPSVTPTDTSNTKVETSAPSSSQKLVRPTSKSNTYEDSYIKKDAKGRVHLDFVNVEISEIVKSISEVTKRNFIFDEKVRGKITLVSPKPVSINEAYRAFISALEVKDLTVIKVGNLYKIVPIRDMKTQPLPSSSATGSYDEFVTRIIPIQHTDANEMSKSLRGLVSKNGDLIAYPATNTLIITDSIANIRRILTIIKKLDQKGFQEGIHVIKLQYAPASDTADKVMKIFELSSQRTPTVPNPNVSTDNNAKFISKVIPDERTNSIIVVANEEGFRRVQELVSQIDRTILEDAAKGRIHVHYLQYADATELSGILSGITPAKSSSSNRGNRNSNMFTPGGTPPPNSPTVVIGGQGGTPLLGEETKINADPYTNSLIITASPSDYESLLPVINKLDIRRPQAFVEAMILEVDIDKASELGTASNLAGTISGSKVFGATTFGSTSSVFLPTDPTSLQGLAVGFQGRTIDIPLAGGESLSIPIFGGFFKALQTNGTVNVLSTPNILTQDNTEAEIVVGQVVPFITAQGRDVNNQPINQIQRENVAITLRLTPQINSSDELTLKIFQESQDLVSGPDVNTFGPTTSKRSAQTTVLVKDGQTVTVGGLINDRIQESTSKVPILGDIPLLGWLFKSKSKTKRKTSLVIFITPHIIRYPEDMERVSIRKNEERMRFNRINGIKEHPGLKSYELDRDLKVPQKQKDSTPKDSPNAQFFQDETPDAPVPSPIQESSDSTQSEETLKPNQPEPPIEMTLPEETPKPEPTSTPTPIPDNTSNNNSAEVTSP